MSQVLARKWRPKTFDQLVGQEHVVRALTNALSRQRLHHAYLFTGTRGVGKTTLARIIAKALNCETGITASPCGKCSACLAIDGGRFVDLIELDAASNTQVDNMRDLLENAFYVPTIGRFKVYIIDEVHMLSRNAFNAMLKTLEEPPEHVKFILATTDPQKIPVTVLSRCLQFNLKQIPQVQIRDQLKKITGVEGVASNDDALMLLARAAHGSMRDALSLLDQSIAHGGGRVDQESVRAMLGSADQEFLHDILRAVRIRDGVGLVAVADRMTERSLSFETALQDLATLLHRVALAQTVPQAISADDVEHVVVTELAAAFSAEEVQLYYQIAVQGRQDLALAPDDYAGFTMTLMRMLAFAPAGAAMPPAKVEPVRTQQSHKPAPVSVTELKKKLTSSDWNDLVKRLPLAGMERMLAHNCELVSWQEGRVELIVPHAQRHLNDRAYQDRLRLALEKHIGHKVKLEISVGPGSGNTLAEIRDVESQQRFTAAAEAIDGDPFVRDLIDNFDARVLPSSVKPAQ